MEETSVHFNYFDIESSVDS